VRANDPLSLSPNVVQEREVSDLRHLFRPKTAPRVVVTASWDLTVNRGNCIVVDTVVLSAKRSKTDHPGYVRQPSRAYGKADLMIAGRGDGQGQSRPFSLNVEARYCRAAELAPYRMQVFSLLPAPA
jgi:hypothetical protein